MTTDVIASAAARRETHERPRVGFIVGPTGAGKTALALTIAERLGAEIVNGDSRQFYRGMDIGTAKPSPDDLRRVPHHLIDIRDPDDPIDAAGFALLARAAILDIYERDRRPLVVGGSGLYLRALLRGICAGPPANPGLRARLADAARGLGVPALHTQLDAIDRAAAARISPNDLARIVRAIEVYDLTGVPLSEHQARHRFVADEFEALTIGVTAPRPLLYASIDRRFDAMIAAGLVDEVRGLIAMGHERSLTARRTIGYREIAAYLRGELDLAAAIALAKRESRRLAKRQLTWFKAEPETEWIDAASGPEWAITRLAEFFASDGGKEPRESARPG